MLNIADIVVILLILVNVIIGYHKGLIKTLISMFSVIASFYIAKISYHPFTDYVLEKFGDPTSALGEKVQVFLLEKISYHPGVMSGPEIDTAIENSDLPKAVVSLLKEKVILSDSYTGTIEQLGTTVASFIIYAVGFVLLFILLLLAFKLLSKLSESITSIPIIKQINKLGGVIVGSVVGLLYIYLALFIVGIFSGTGAMEKVISMIQESAIASYFYNHNMIVWLIKGALTKS